MRDGAKDDTISNGDLKAMRKFREKQGHSFVVDAVVHETTSKATRKRICVSHHARLRDRLGDDRVVAMQLVWMAFMAITRGMDAQAVNLMNVGGASMSGETRKDLQTLYWKWARRLQEKRLCHSSCIDTAVFGRSPHEVDNNRRQDHGKAMRNLIECLDEFIAMGCLKLWKGSDVDS